MNGINQNSYSDLIYSFMDGEANSVQQKVLFDALAKDSELQNEFQHAVEISKGFNADKSMLTPPAKLTNTLFLKAGFDAPMNPYNPSFWVKIKQYSTPILSTAAGSLVTALLIFSLYNPIKDFEQNSGSSTFIQNINQENTSDDLNSIPIIKSIEVASIKPKSNNQFSNIASILPVEQNTSSANPESEDKPFSYPSAIISYNNLSINNNINKDMTFSEINSPEFSPIIPNVNILNLLLEVKGISGFAFFPNRTIEAEDFSIVNNISLGLMYKINAHHSAGISIGSESLQMYSVVSKDNEPIFTLEPNLFWIAANYRYVGNEIYGSLYPYAELSAAFTKFGPLEKAVIGITYNPENFFSMSIGLEGSSLQYNYFLGDYKHTEKISLVYNVGFHF